jgi:DNA primase
MNGRTAERHRGAPTAARARGGTRCRRGDGELSNVFEGNNTLMAGRIPDEIIQEVLDRTNIVELIGGYLPLRQAGSRWKGLCPFHTEKTPSFMVNPERQIFHCFGCGKGGSAFAFLMEQERFSFPEAVRFLADRAGIRVPAARGGDREAEGRLRLVEVHRLAAEQFRANLAGAEGAAARRYLEGRGLEPNTVERFQLGYAPGQWDALLRHLVRAGYRPEEVERAGLAAPRRDPGGGAGRSGAYDRFRDRVMIPIADASGKVIAFGGRALRPEDVKYINSPETPLYRKGMHLYGLHLAARPIREEGWAILVEGYFDLIGLHRAGFHNAVAALGTALTAQQVEVLARYTDRAVLAFDPDRAGLQAALRGIELLLARGLAVEVAALPEGLDPDGLVAQRGRDGVAEVLARTADVVDFAWAAAGRAARRGPRASGPGAEGVDEAVQAGEAVLGVLARMGPGIRRDKYAQKLAERLGVGEASIQAELARRGPGRATAAASAPLPAASPAGAGGAPRPRVSVEGELLQLLLLQPERIAATRAVVSPDDFIDPTLRRLFEMVCEGEALGGPALTHALVGHEDEAIRAAAGGLLMADEGKFEEGDRVFADFLRYFARRRADRVKRRIRQEMETAGKAGDPETLERAKAAHPGWRRAGDAP